MNNAPKFESKVSLTINGKTTPVFIRHAETLLFTLRNKIGIMSTKPGCYNGDCGSCTVLINHVPINACHMLTIEAANEHITTIEGLTDPILQEAFMNHWALQCGYCTPGLILNTYALVTKMPDATDEVIDEWLDSNICRCTGYQEIKEAVKYVLTKKEISHE